MQKYSKKRIRCHRELFLMPPSKNQAPKPRSRRACAAPRVRTGAPPVSPARSMVRESAAPRRSRSPNNATRSTIIKLTKHSDYASIAGMSLKGMTFARLWHSGCGPLHHSTPSYRGSNILLRPRVNPPQSQTC
jgi:hypothetical protein